VKIYQAGIYASNFQLNGPAYNRLTVREKRARNEVRFILESYHYIQKQPLVDKLRRDKAVVFLDSGAYSAYTKGIQVSLDGYCDYIKRNQDIIELPSVLDSIGDPKQTWLNQKTMEDNGIRPLPCFHYGEDERYLSAYLDEYDYISLGGLVPISTPQLIMWLDRIWDRYLVGEDRMPRVKVHAFGITHFQTLRRYPWFSVDSTLWLQSAANGILIIPPSGKKIPVSDRSVSRHKAGQHVDTISVVERQVVEDSIRSRGFEWKRMQQQYLARWAFNLHAMDEINKDIERERLGTDGTFIKEQPEIFA
jgi:hypothetical protein